MFREKELKLKDRERFGQPEKFEDGKLQHPVDQNSTQTGKKRAVHSKLYSS